MSASKQSGRSSRAGVPRAETSWRICLAAICTGLGLASLIVALIAAWRSSSPTAAFIAGVVLLVVAWLIVDRSVLELTAAHGNTSVGMRRELSDAVERSENIDDPAEALSSLQYAVLNMAAAESSEAQGAQDRWLADLIPKLRSGMILDTGPPDVAYVVNPPRGEPYRSSTINASIASWWGDYVVRCQVTAENGVATARFVFSSTGMMSNRFGVLYPDQFRGAGVGIRPGRYLFEWFRVEAPDGGPWIHHPAMEQLVRDEVIVREEDLVDGADSRRVESRRIEWDVAWPDPVL